MCAVYVARDLLAESLVVKITLRARKKRRLFFVLVIVCINDSRFATSNKFIVERAWSREATFRVIVCDCGWVIWWCGVAAAAVRQVEHRVSGMFRDEY